MKRAKAVAVLQIFGGLAGVVEMATSRAPRATPAFLNIFALSAFFSAVVAGVLLWREDVRGVRFSKVVQLAQLCRFTSSQVTYSFYVGLWLAPMIQWPDVGFSAELGGAFIARLHWGGPAPEATTSVGINLVAVAALFCLSAAGAHASNAANPSAVS